MSDKLTLALDAMGGDDAPRMVLRGANIAVQRAPAVSFMIFGDEARIKPILDELPRLKDVSTLHHTDHMVSGDAKPSTALRSGRQSSMRLAIDAVREGRAQGVVSAGNTGALMVMAKMVLKMLPGIDRPAMASYFPTMRGESVMLDLGANVECDANNLFQFAVMGEVFARTVLGLERPTIGILNVGSEELKGHEEVRSAAALLRASNLPIQFHGFIEGDDITAGTVDVVVTDGFTGNVALKTAEGTVVLFNAFLRGAFRSSLMARLGYLLAKQAMNKVRKRTDPRRYNGAILLGLNGIVVKSHGGTDAVGFANAVAVGVDMAVNRFNDRIKAEFARLNALPAERQAAASA